MRVFRYLLGSVRFIVRTLGGLWSALMTLLMVASLALTFTMSLVPGVLGAVAGAVEGVTGIKSVVTKAETREAHLKREQVRLQKTLKAEQAARQTETRALRKELIHAQNDAREAVVRYRGEKMAIREAVHDTAERAARRTARTAARSVGSAAAEALPVVGVSVIVATVAWELHESCEMMKDMRELDVAFNPDDPIGEDEICGIKPPSRQEIWQTVKSSPGAAWDRARGFHVGLPEFSASRSYEWMLAKFSGSYDWMAEKVSGGSEEE